MVALQPLEVRRTLKAAGLTVSLMPDSGLMVSPVRLLTDDLRDLIRAHKPALVDLLKRQAAVDQVEAELEMVEERFAIMAHEAGLAPDLAAVMAKRHCDFLLHLWKCPSCIAAGQGRRHRCEVGAPLWARYQQAEAEADAAKPQPEWRSPR